MPELPEVHTTATMLNKLVKNKVISDVWTDYDSPYYAGKDNIKNPIYFKKFNKEISGKRILKVWRRAKNVLIDIEGGKTILVHMKMTGHLLYSKYAFDKNKNTWTPEDKDSLFADPFNRFVHLVFILSDGKHVAFSDMRKFATVTLIPDKIALNKLFSKIGPEPLEENFTVKYLKERLQLKPNGKIKTVLMNHEIVAGIGNIYSDEILWDSGVQPERKISTLSESEIKEIFKNSKKLLSKGIDSGGDSMSDYRNPLGEKGKFQLHHSAYRRTGKPCLKKGCGGIIVRKVVDQRSAHFCDTHQK